MAHSERLEEIRAAVSTEMALNGIPDTDENRLIFCQGLYDAWAEDPAPEDPVERLEKTFYMMALSGEIFGLKLRVQFPSAFEEVSDR